MSSKFITVSKKQKVYIYSDGSAKGTSDGPGGYGTIVRYMTENNKIDRVMEYTEGFKVTTNNRMELMGTIIGLESLTQPSDVIIFSDSKYVVDAFNHDWISNWLSNGWVTANRQPVKNTDLWKRLLEAKKPHDCTFVWVKGHNGHPENERCDYLAQSSSNGVLFERKEDGTLKPIQADLKDDTGLSEKDLDTPKISLNTIVKEYVDKLGKDIKNYTTTINGAKFICDEEENLSPHPDEDIDKCKKVLDSLEKFFKDEKTSKLFQDIFTPTFDGYLSTIFNSIFGTSIDTGNTTIPKIQVKNNGAVATYHDEK